MNIDDEFWSQIDPLYHLKQATCLISMNNIGQHYHPPEHLNKDSEFCDELLAGMDEMQASALMFIRFHAIETLFTVLLGSHPHGPIPRFSRKFFGKKFNDALQSLARKEIPAALGIRGVTAYDKWISAKFWCIIRDDYDLDDEIIDFISIQAELFGKKSVYNAFKHGCRIGNSCHKFTIKDDDTGEWLSLLETKSGVGWIDWEEDKKSPSPKVTFGTMSCDPVDDYGAVWIMAALVRAMKIIRLAKPGDKIKVQLPAAIKAGMHVPALLSIRIALSPNYEELPT